MSVKRYFQIAWNEFVDKFDPDTKAKAAGAGFAALLIGLGTALGYVSLYFVFTHTLPDWESVLHAAGFSGFGGGLAVNHVSKHAKARIIEQTANDVIAHMERPGDEDAIIPEEEEPK
jgi:hypothetical protein